MFLIGGGAFSGTTLLTLLLNQPSLVCLDEPDFHDPRQAHRGIPFLRALFPQRVFPDPPARPLGYEETVRLTEDCARAIEPLRLGVKTCDRPFLGLSRVYRRRGYPVIAIVRDIRDVLVRDLPAWVTEASLNASYRMIWREIGGFDLWFRYEDLVADPDAALASISAVLSCSLRAPRSWRPEAVQPTMLKLDRHDLLKTGRISAERVGIWKASGRRFERETHETAKLMGYA
ncbi:MAG: hypothetical protein ACREQQ_17655 [Candidatus Binatia bacterium]